MNIKTFMIIVLGSACITQYTHAHEDAALTSDEIALVAPEEVNNLSEHIDIGSQKYLIDTIKVVLYTEESADIITQSDVDRRGLDGSYRSQDDVVLERLMFQDAMKFKIIPDESVVDKHLKAVQRENNLTHDQLKDVFKSAGYTYEEGRQQFTVMTTVNSVLDFRIRSRLIIPERDVMEYHEANPIVEPAAYFLERAVVSFTDSKSELEKKLQKFATTHKGFPDIIWSRPFWISHTDLAEEKMFLAFMTVGQISMPEEVEDGFEVYRLRDRKKEQVASLEERYRDIADTLRRPLYEKLMNEYRDTLYASASIVYL